MTTYEKCKAIRKSILTNVGESLTYDWSSSYKLENITDIKKTISRWEEKYGESFSINPFDLTEEEMINLDFGRVSENSKSFLLPIWLYPFLADAFPSSCIDGSLVMKKSDMDTDHRCGWLAYAVNPKGA